MHETQQRNVSCSDSLYGESKFLNQQQQDYSLHTTILVVQLMPDLNYSLFITTRQTVYTHTRTFHFTRKESSKSSLSPSLALSPFTSRFTLSLSLFPSSSEGRVFRSVNFGNLLMIDYPTTGYGARIHFHIYSQ